MQRGGGDRGFKVMCLRVILGARVSLLSRMKKSLLFFINMLARRGELLYDLGVKIGEKSC